MKTSFSELKQKEAINVSDGKRLGKPCDLVFSYPDGCLLGILVPGGRGIRWGKDELFVELKNVVKIGEDVILIKLASGNKCESEEEKCERSNCPPFDLKSHDRRDFNDCK